MRFVNSAIYGSNANAFSTQVYREDLIADQWRIQGGPTLRLLFSVSDSPPLADYARKSFYYAAIPGKSLYLCSKLVSIMLHSVAASTTAPPTTCAGVRNAHGAESYIDRLRSASRRLSLVTSHCLHLPTKTSIVMSRFTEIAQSSLYTS